MAANAPMLTKAAMVDGHPEVGILPTGQVVGVIDELPTVAELVARSSRRPSTRWRGCRARRPRGSLQEHLRSKCNHVNLAQGAGA